MSLKPVELQFALHKNEEAGLKQNQLNHKPVEDQAQLADASMKQAERQRQTLSKPDPSGQAGIREQNKDSASKRNGKKGRTSASSSASDQPGLADRRDHPFKGKHIDLTM